MFLPEREGKGRRIYTEKSLLKKVVPMVVMVAVVDTYILKEIKTFGLYFT
jgi:hypothetical protein